VKWLRWSEAFGPFMPRSTLRAELSVLGLTASTKIEFPKKTLLFQNFLSLSVDMSSIFHFILLPFGSFDPGSGKLATYADSSADHRIHACCILSQLCGLICPCVRFFMASKTLAS
jgi:hypothetical protein